METELNIFFENKDDILDESSQLPEFFPISEKDSDDFEPENEYDLGYITDFSKILAFGMNGSGNYYAMDFSENSDNPRIIYWDDFDLRWRIIADNLDEFFALFKEEDL